MEPVIPLAALSLAALGIEARRLGRSREKIRLRIHVNGTRGKSTTVRLIAAMLQGAGVRTAAKTTGGQPFYIDTTGKVHVWKRRGAARLSEQMAFLRRAAAEGAEAVVLECMAVDPYLQWVSEHRILQATHTVITNVRNDHREVMGRTRDEMARSMANSIPTGTQLFLGDQQHQSVFAPIARERGTTLSVAREQDKNTLARQLGIGPEGRGFLECAALAALVARSLGLLNDEILSVLKNWPSEQSVQKRQWRGVPVFVIDALAANDPESAGYLWARVPESSNAYIIYHHRRDRPLRLEGFLRALASTSQFQELIITGSISRHHLLLRRYRRLSACGSCPALTAAGTRRALQRIDEIVESVRSPWLVFAGNEVGLPAPLGALLGRDQRKVNAADDSICHRPGYGS